MAAFSSDPQISLNTVINIESKGGLGKGIDSKELAECVEWIKRSGLGKVCLQFPDCLLADSVDAALFLERETSTKTYILADTSYGSCCTDEIAAEHVNADGIIHFGHACLSPVSKLPVFYVFPKKELDVEKFYADLQNIDLDGPTLLLYDVGFLHKVDELRNLIPMKIRDKLVISQLDIGIGSEKCCEWCQCLTGDSKHSKTKLGRMYCLPNSKHFMTVFYIGEKESINLNNFLCSIKGPEFIIYTKSGLERISNLGSLTQISYLVEKLKCANNIGILAATLAIKGYLEAIEHVKKLCKRSYKKTHVFAIGKPSPTKLANFPEIDVFVVISCPEAEFGDRKNYMQPLVGLYEVELAFNENRTWAVDHSKDFRDLIPGGSDFILCPESSPTEEMFVSLISNRIQGAPTCSSNSMELTQRSDMEVAVNNTSSFTRSWNGLQQTLGDTPVVPAVEGRSGVPCSYENEKL